MILPRYIAICGNPKSGKSLLQKILQDKFDAEPVDDGLPLRQMAMDYFGASRCNVFTQDGKAELAYWPNGEPIVDVRDGSHMDWRNVLGRIGKQFEDMFGEFIMPMICCARLAEKSGPFSFGSVRRGQGWFYRKQGGIVIGLRNPLAGPSGNDFDLFDESAVNHWIDNDALARGLTGDAAVADLAGKVEALFACIGHQAAA